MFSVITKIQRIADMEINMWKLILEKVIFLLSSNIVEEFRFDNVQFTSNQGFGWEKDGNLLEFISSNLVIFCYKEFGKFVLCESVSKLEATFIVYSGPIECRH